MKSFQQIREETEDSIRKKHQDKFDDHIEKADEYLEKGNDTKQAHHINMAHRTATSYHKKTGKKLNAADYPGYEHPQGHISYSRRQIGEETEDSIRIKHQNKFDDHILKADEYLERGDKKDLIKQAHHINMAHRTATSYHKKTGKKLNAADFPGYEHPQGHISYSRK